MIGKCEKKKNKDFTSPLDIVCRSKPATCRHSWTRRRWRTAGWCSRSPNWKSRYQSYRYSVTAKRRFRLPLLGSLYAFFFQIAVLNVAFDCAVLMQLLSTERANRNTEQHDLQETVSKLQQSLQSEQQVAEGKYAHMSLEFVRFWKGGAFLRGTARTKWQLMTFFNDFFQSAQDGDPWPPCGAAVIWQGAHRNQEWAEPEPERAAEGDGPALQQSDEHAASTRQSPVSLKAAINPLLPVSFPSVLLCSLIAASRLVPKAGVGAAPGASSGAAGLIWPAASWVQVWGWSGQTAAAEQAAGGRWPENSAHGQCSYCFICTFFLLKHILNVLYIYLQYICTVSLCL